MYNTDFMKEVEKAIAGNAHFFICEKGYRIEGSGWQSIHVKYGLSNRMPHESCWNFVLESELFNKYEINYVDCDGSWYNFATGDHVEDMRFILCCKPLLSNLTIDEYKEVAFNFAKRNKAPGIIFNDYERNVIQLIRFGKKEILELPHDNFSLIKYLGYLYNFNPDTLYEYSGVKEYIDYFGPRLVGHTISPDENFFEFENKGLYKLRLNDQSFEIIFGRNGISERNKSADFYEELEIMKNMSVVIEYSKFPVQLLEIIIHESSSENIDFIHSAILYAKEKIKLPLKKIDIRIYSDCRDLRIISNTSEKDHIYFAVIDK